MLVRKTQGEAASCSLLRGSRDGAVVRALASHQCGPGSIPGLGVICGLSLLLVLVLAPGGFSPGTPVFPSPQKPTFPNSNSILTQWKKSHPVDPLLIPIYFIYLFYLRILQSRECIVYCRPVASLPRRLF